MQRLTPEQQKLVEESIWVVNSVMKEQKLDGDKDIRQQALLYMCKCAQRFDATRGTKWTTYAYKNANLYIKRLVAKTKQIQSRFDSIEETPIEIDLYGCIEPETDKVEKYIVESLKTRCSPLEFKILAMKSQGYKGYEIKRELKCSSATLKIQMDNIREKAKEIME